MLRPPKLLLPKYSPPEAFSVFLQYLDEQGFTFTRDVLVRELRCKGVRCKGVNNDGKPLSTDDLQTHVNQCIASMVTGSSVVQNGMQDDEYVAVKVLVESDRGHSEPSESHMRDTATEDVQLPTSTDTLENVRAHRADNAF